ncbi:MAG: glycosyltransferase, partial [Verrucomicrobiota bacterium]
EGHFDSLMIAPLIGGLWLWESKRYHAACAVATIGSGIKWMTLPLVPFLANRRIVSCGLVAVACLGLPFVFYGSGALQALTALFEFGGTRSFNGPLYDLLTIEIDLSRTIANACSACAFLLILLWRWFWRGRASFDSHCLWILGSLIVFSPTVHFWYIAWLLPFVALSPRIPWLVLSFSAGAYFFVWTNVEAGSYWRLTQSQRMIFWVPFLVSCLYELWSTRGQVLRLKRLRPPDPGRVAVIIPTLNAEENIEAALQSVARQTVRPDEIVLVDAGSVDATLERAAAMNLELSVIESERGRGNQIAAGVEAAGSDWVLILHADAILDPHSVERLKRAYDSHPQMIAGALGQRFDGEHWQLSIIELLNELRAIFTRTAFGDQVQFFHRQTAIERELMPKQPLMEDVESSWRARTNGEFVYLGCSCLVSRRKWDHKDWFKRVIFVVRLLIRYRIARARGLKAAAEMSRQLYSEYYKSPS